MVLIKADEFNACKYPLALVLQKHSELNKEYTGYYKPILENNLEGKMFKSYSMARIETRRISNPAQTMKGSLKALIRSYSDDYYMCDFDMSQVEYRIMLSLSQHMLMVDRMKDPREIIIQRQQVLLIIYLHIELLRRYVKWPSQFRSEYHMVSVRDHCVIRFSV